MRLRKGMIGLVATATMAGATLGMTPWLAAGVAYAEGGGGFGGGGGGAGKPDAGAGAGAAGGVGAHQSNGAGATAGGETRPLSDGGATGATSAPAARQPR